MEELQSTEILDREILEDARKKAHRILKTAEDTIKTKSAEGEKNLDTALGELAKKYAQQREAAINEIMVRLPIDQRRIKAKKIEELLYGAVESWYAGLSRKRILDLLKKELAKRIACSAMTAANGMKVQIHKIEKTEAETLMQAVLPGVPYEMEKIVFADTYPGITLETPEVRIHAFISKTVDFYLGEKRAELIEALLENTALLDRTDSPGSMEIAGEEAP